jgi:PTH1 family peptidyl-tRNA hydrolase
MKFLICGLGNIGDEYAMTRHNIGFRVLDAFAKASNLCFKTDRLGDIAETRIKNQQLLLLKPSTFMNLSGNAVRYWMQQEKIDVDHLLVINDDIALPFGQLRLRPSGSAGGHNGLKDIARVVGGENYARLRFGVGNDYPKGGQIDWVLGKFPADQEAAMPERLDMACEIIRSFCLAGIQVTMNQYNKK